MFYWSYTEGLDILIEDTNEDVHIAAMEALGSLGEASVLDFDLCTLRDPCNIESLRKSR